MGSSEDSEIIRARRLTKIFGQTLAVDELDLRVGRGEIFGLVGPDGAGKTTTIRLLASVLVPTRGSVSIAGYDTICQAEAVKRCLGYMPQHFSLYGDLTVRENLHFFADLYHVRGEEREERIRRLLTFARLVQFQSRRAEHLSGGMQKKVALACTLLHRPELLLLDEPTTGIDPISRRELWQLFQGLHLEGITLFISTPYMDEAERCSRVGLMMEGRLIVCDEPRAIKALVKGELAEVRPSHLRQAYRALEGCPGVLELQTYGDTLRIFVDDFHRRRKELEEHLQAEGITFQRMHQVRPRMEEAFISLIRRGQRWGAE